MSATTLYRCLMICAGIGGFTESVAAEERIRRPNVLLIVADDQRSDTIGALGNVAIRTPTLDRMARAGTNFTRAVCAYPICVVSRAELLTGCTAFRAMQPYPYGNLNDELPLLPEVLQTAGYRTAYVGKWHTSGRPKTRGYETSYGLFAAGAGAMPLTHPLDRFGNPVTGFRGWVQQDDTGKTFPERGVGLTPNISETFAAAAIQAISPVDASDERPFFVHVNFTAPHDPRFTPRGFEWNDRLLPQVPANFAARHPFDHGNQEGRDEVLLPRPLTEQTVREELAIYYALIEHLDAQVGRILERLDQLGERENTIVIYTSDHGLALGSHGLTGKQNMYEHTIGVPLVAMGPGIPKGKQIAAQCYLRDLFPTICEWCGTATPAGLDGRSLQPLIDGRIRELYSEVFGYFTDTQQMLRTDRWKYVRYPRVEREQLFDLRNDPQEMHDLIQAPEHASLKATFQIRLDDWFKQNATKQIATLQIQQAKNGKPEPLQAPFDAATARTGQKAWAEYLGVDVDATNSLGGRMILIPPGTFAMGSTDEYVEAAWKTATELKSTDGLLNFIRNSERPRHRVVLSKPWRIGATEVTIGQFRKFVEAAKYLTEAERYGFGEATKTVADEKIRAYQRPLRWNALRSDATEDEPVTQVTWNDAQAFCKWLSEQEHTTYRLPTEAEWEYACRAGTKTLYSFGDDHEQLEQYAWYGKNANGKSHPVGEKQANAFGLFDMHGNVNEWCRDYYGEKWYADSPSKDPRGPESGSHRVIRGGLWPNNAAYCRSAARYSRGATARHRFLGFRVIQDL